MQKHFGHFFLAHYEAFAEGMLGMGRSNWVKKDDQNFFCVYINIHYIVCELSFKIQSFTYCSANTKAYLYYE